MSNGSANYIKPIRMLEVELTFYERALCAYVKEDGRLFQISRRLTYDAGPSMFIRHLLRNPLTYTYSGELAAEIENGDITELIRGCGFNRRLKKIFFRNTDEQKAELLRVVYLTPSEIKVIEANSKRTLKVGNVEQFQIGYY